MTRRTTLSAEADDLEVLQDEARRRGVSLAAVLRELVAREASLIRSRRRPRIGFASGDGTSSEDLIERDPDAPFRSPYRS